MLKKTIKFKDLDGNQLEEDFYFNLTKADIAEMEIGEAKHGGLSAILEKIVAETDGKKILELLNEIVRRAYGEKSSDGRRFIKNDEVWENFYYTDAHSELLFELYTDSASAAAFVRGIAPAEFSDKMGDTDGMSPEEIRKLAMESMQGHKTKQEKSES